MPDLSLILPVLNEENIITPVVEDIMKVLELINISFEIILVENESTDRTWEVINLLAEKDKRIVATRTKQGYGSAIIAGIKIARGDFICYMPSDGQIDSKILIPLWQEAKTGKADVVKIRRKNRESIIRLVRSKAFNLLTRFLYPIDVSDINGSPRIIKTDKLKQLELSFTDSFIDTEFAVKAHLLGWKFKEIAMTNLVRVGGKSTVGIHTIIEFLRNLWSLRLDIKFINWQEKYLN
ncbi:hypothetical protein A3D03_04870 [Candidatus Gottesmanbacteria bacterium RIFCSPHIGHO2_02_FULL_40_13]|uniref:Glycosyltransferase 2-like domain-containing protein n=1 Tax=Candidatus Gottesmanbacteria bacterium RIFCSPHIGHO2_02_FULL_40_13 TaxID=1798384 RepID=A0A1F6A9V3_9BACT|nr:MAG: hypothetical protein A3D03_04870 [Candidatus Gottesmanbacteria bacterium RIFCSPHIGHO2_02_FULL_40_13]